MTSSRAPRADAARNREKLLACARQVFAKRGADASVSEIAKAAGVGQGTAFRHFASKEELMCAAMDAHIDELLAFARECVAIEDPWDGLTRFCEELVQRYRTDRGFLQSVKQNRLGPHGEECMGEFMTIVEDLLARNKQAGNIREDVTQADIKLMLTAAGDVSENADAPANASERILRLMLDGMRAAPVSS